jgi:UDP-glucose 4-epimerase
MPGPAIESTFQGKRILITGGLGFIGSNLARRLAEAGAKVVLLDSLIPEYGGNLFNIDGLEDRVRVNISDVRDAHSMRYLVQNQDYLFNLAGQTSHVDSMQDPAADLEINCRAQLSDSRSLPPLQSAVRVVFASTRRFTASPILCPSAKITCCAPST